MLQESATVRFDLCLTLLNALTGTKVITGYMYLCSNIAYYNFFQNIINDQAKINNIKLVETVTSQSVFIKLIEYSVVLEYLRGI